MTTRRRLLHVLVLFGLAGVLAFYVVEIEAWSRGRAASESDFRVFHAAARSLVGTGDPYPPTLPANGENLNNPHTTALLFAPFAGLPFRDAFLAYTTLSLLLMLAAVPFLVGAAGGGREPFAHLATALLLLAWPQSYRSAVTGQVGVVLLLPVAVGWWALAKGRERLGGAALGAVLGMKVFAGLFAPALLLARRVRAAAALVVTGAALYGIGLVSFGWGAYARHFRILRDVQVTGYGNNASLMATAVRLELPAPLLAALMAVVLVAVLWVAWNADGPGPVLGATVPGMLLLSPLAWYYYLPLLAVTLLVAWVRGGWPRWLAAGAWVVAGVPGGELSLTPETVGLALMLIAMVGAAAAGRPLPGVEGPRGSG
ncbi:MAG: glycosyltransferase family 87 protein [Gemmatimonadota bacterium]